MGPGFALLTAVTAGGVALGVLESRAHRRVLDSIALRIHVNGTRGKTSVTRAIATLLRALGRRTVAKCTGTLPLFIGPDGDERPWERRGRPRVHEQMRFLRRAAWLGADAVAVECMAVEPALQWVAEHQLVRSHIGVITNVRTDHLEQMGGNMEQIARSLANTIPRNGVLVTGDVRFYPLFESLARPLGTRVVLAEPEQWESGVRHAFPENHAIACTVARAAGYSEAAIRRAAQSLVAVDDGPPVVPLSGLASGAVFVHAWAINDPESYAAFLTSGRMPTGNHVPLFNHRSDRPLRTVVFGRLFREGPPLPRLLVTGDAGAERLFVRAGIERERIRRVPFPPSTAVVAAAVADLPGPIVVVGCGNARGVAALEAEARRVAGEHGRRTCRD